MRQIKEETVCVCNGKERTDAVKCISLSGSDRMVDLENADVSSREG